MRKQSYRFLSREPKNMLSYDVSQYDKNSAEKISFSVSSVPEWAFHYQNIWNGAKLLLFQKLITEPIKGDGKYMNSKINTCKERIKKSFMVKTFHMTCIAIQQ